MLQSVEQYVTLFEKQKEGFSTLFFMMLLQDLAYKENKDEAELK